MKSTRLFRNFVFLFSLLGLGGLAWGDRYETIFIQTIDTPNMDHSSAVAYLKSNACISIQTLQIPEGEIAYVLNSGASPRPSSTCDFSGTPKEAFVTSLIIDIQGLESNQSIGTWDPNTTIWDTNNLPIGNLSDNTQPIVGPSTVRIGIKPWSARNNSHNDNYWAHSSRSQWDFKASEGYVTFRIVGSEQAPSKKFATVIPENASTNIRVVLEQSTDLINWSSANPGVFPPSTSKRFFRVRSVEE